MTSSGNHSEVNVRPRRYRGIRSSKKIVLYSDYNTEEETKNGSLGQRSISLTALPHNGSNSVSAATTPVPTSPGPLLEPRMAQLETLEAKMASIEVSLSTAQRRKMGKKNGGQAVSNVGKTTQSLGLTSPSSIFASIRSNTLADTCRELEVLRNALKDKENTIQNLQGQINCGGRLNASFQPLDPAERRSAELRLRTLKQEEESRKSAIKKINLTLEEMDDDEANIDVSIRRAELEYELGREELGLLGVREELGMLQARLDVKPTLTLYSSVKSSGKFTLHCVQVEYDPKSPRFGAGSVDDKIGLFVLWAGENSGMQKGDRILEVNGKLTLSTGKEEMIRLLTVCPSKAEIVLLRTWTPPSTEDYLRRENLRLTHRISYLEDQVSELLKEIPNVDAGKRDDEQTEIFQKGSHVALLSTGHVKSGGTKTNGINRSGFAGRQTSGDSASETCQEQDVPDNGIGNATRNRDDVVSGVANGYHKTLGSGRKYQDFDNRQTSKISNEKIRNLTRKYERDDISNSPAGRRWEKNNETVEENPRHLSDLEKSSRKSDRHHQHHHHHHHHHHHPNNHQNRLIDYSSETSCFNYGLSRDRKIETDDDSVHRKSEQENDRHAKKPIPPKKPLRLSINRATSLQNVDSGYSIPSAVRKIKRSHKGEAPPPPFLKCDKFNGNNDSLSDSNNLKNVSKVDNWKSQSESSQSNFCWPPNIHHIKSKMDEKWC